MSELRAARLFRNIVINIPEAPYDKLDEEVPGREGKRCLPEPRSERHHFLRRPELAAVLSPPLSLIQDTSHGQPINPLDKGWRIESILGSHCHTDSPGESEPLPS